MTELEPRLNDSDAQRVLARALELQAHHAGTLSVTQVREIAAEMSIPESAVDQALAEYRGTATIDAFPARPAATTFWKRRVPANPIVLAMAFIGTTLMLLIVASMAIRLFP